MSRRMGLAVLLILVIGGSIWWGIHPPRTHDGYRSRTVKTLEALHSQVASTMVWLDAVDNGRVLRTTAAVAVTEAETDASSSSSSYAAWQPPDRASEQLRSRVTVLADQVVGALGQVRIAVREGRWSRAVAMHARLASLERRLADLAAAAKAGGAS